jgi:lysophospholipase L1-like esterase
MAKGLPKALSGVTTLVVMGDSITEGGAAPGGYVWLLAEALAKAESGIRVVNAGISGHRAPDMAARFERDALAHKPDLILLNVGVNDVWHAFNIFETGARDPQGLQPAGVPVEDYTAYLEEIADKAAAAGARLAFVSPTLVYEDLNCAENIRAATYVSAMRAVAIRRGLPFVDAYLAFRETVAAFRRWSLDETLLLTTDGVHLNAAGNALLAGSIWNALGE